MKATLFQNWDFIDFSKPTGQRKVELPAGVYEIERVPNPLNDAGRALVLKGTTIGGAEGYWRQWDKDVLVIEE